MSKTFIIILVIVLMTAAAYFVILPFQSPKEVGESEKKSEPSEQEIAANIIVFNPAPGDEVGLPLKVEGRARVFESTVNLRLKEKDGKILIEDIVMAQSLDMGEFGNFEKELLYPEPEQEEGILEVFQVSAKDGSEIDKVTIPLKFKKISSLTIKVFFGNVNEDPQTLVCDKVYPVERRIPKTLEVAQVSLIELLKGPTISEKNQGFLTAISPGVKIQSLTLKDGVIKADFDEQLEYQAGGSCRIAMILAQITETLKQFPTINDVIISINGRTEYILQP